MAVFDLGMQYTTAPSFLPGTAVSGSSAINGGAVDCNNISDPVTFVAVYCGTATGTPDSATVAVKLQESDATGSGWADCAIQYNVASVAAKGSAVFQAIRTKRYVRAVVTPTFSNGTSPTLPTAVVITCPRVFAGGSDATSISAV